MNDSAKKRIEKIMQELPRAYMEDDPTLVAAMATLKVDADGEYEIDVVTYVGKPQIGG